MLDEKTIQNKIDDAHLSMEESKLMFGKEIYQKRFKPIYEGYITALCSVLEKDEDGTTDDVKGKQYG